MTSSVRLDNPTKDTLEQAAVVVPFALDRQIGVERTGAATDRIAKLVTVQRGVVTAEVQHRRQTTFVITSRLHLPSTLYLRNQLADLKLGAVSRR